MNFRPSGASRLLFATLIIVGSIAVLVVLAGKEPEHTLGGRPIGQTVELDSGFAVTLVSADNVPPESWLKRGVGAISRDDRLWLAFNVQNSSEATLSVPGRPEGAFIRPIERVRNLSIHAYVDGEGGGFGPAAEPYLEPGDAMHVLIEYEVIDPKRPLQVHYSPTMMDPVVYLIR